MLIWLQPPHRRQLSTVVDPVVGDWTQTSSVSPKPFMVAGGILNSNNSWIWNAPPISATGGQNYRFQVWQGTPPFGAAPNPIQADYGSGALDTYLRFELRRGQVPGTNPYDGTYDEWQSDYNSPNDRNQQGRLRIEISCTDSNAPAVITGPDSNKTRRYEWDLYLPATYSGQYLGVSAPRTPEGRHTQVSLQQLYSSPHPTIYAPDDNDTKLKFYRPGHATGTWSSTTDVDDLRGKWLRFQLDIVYAASGRFDLKADLSGTGAGYSSVSSGTGVQTWKSGYDNGRNRVKPKLGFYLTHTAGLDRPSGSGFSSDLYVPGSRETVVWYGGWRFWDSV